MSRLTATGAVVLGLATATLVAAVNSSAAKLPTINATPSETSATPGDSVTETATLKNVTADAGGTVTYSLYSALTCTGTVVFSSVVTVVNGVVPQSSPY